MADPVFVDCLADQWTKVATNVTSGQIHKWNPQPQEYLHTYRATGGAAPTDKAEGVRIFIGDNISESISASAGIDVYLYPITENGRVRVDV